MSLRVRMGLAAGVAVALAVIAVAITAYAGTRSQLRGQVDQSLQTLAQPMLVRAGVFGPPGLPARAIQNPGARSQGVTTEQPSSGEGTAKDSDGAQDATEKSSSSATATTSSSAAAAGTTSAASAAAAVGTSASHRLTPAASTAATPVGGLFAGSQPGAGPGQRALNQGRSRQTATIRVISSGGHKLGISSGDCDNGLGIDDTRGGGFGGAQGYVQLVSPTADRVCLPINEATIIPIGFRVRTVAASGRGHYLADTEVGSTQLRTLVYGLGSRGALMVALPLTDVIHTLNKQILLLLLISAAGILLAGLLGLLVARTALLPIARFTRQTELIAANPERLESQRLDIHGGDELARLAMTFNRTLDSLDESVQSQRNLVADASHELRTPIATIRANLQLMRDEKLLSGEDRDALRRDIIEELDELTALVGDVVELARGSKPSAEPGDLRFDAIVAEAIERTRRRAPQLTVASSLEPTLIRGEGDRIARAVTNLLDNAAKWSPAGETVEVTLAAGVLTVRDHGPGFHEEDLPFIFDRFHRARDARSKPGSGLGLAIVRQAAEAHRGFVKAANHPDGGAQIQISFGPVLDLDDEDPASDKSDGAERATAPGVGPLTHP